MNPLLLIAALGACSDKTASRDSGAAAPTPACTDCALGNAQNYTIASTLEADVVRLAALTDARIDWSALTVDVQGHPVEAGDVTQVLLVAFAELEPEDVMAGLASDQLTQSAAAIYVTCEPADATSCQLSDFAILGSTFDVEEYFLEEVGAWLVVPTSSGAQGGKTFLFLKADSTSAQTEARIDNQTAALTVDVDLRSAAPLVLPAGEAQITLDWTDLDVDGLGNPMEARTLDRLLLARYDASPEALEGRIFELETGAAEMWTLDIGGGTTAGLAAAQGDQPFTGITDDGTWLLALRCSTCTHPAPRFMTQLVTGPLP